MVSSQMWVENDGFGMKIPEGQTNLEKLYVVGSSLSQITTVLTGD